MRIKLDENLSWRLKEIIEQQGHDVSTAASENLLGKRDVDIALAAKEEKRMIFSLDLDFADLRKFPPGTHPGMIVFRPNSRGPNVVNAFVSEFIKKTDLNQLRGFIVIVDKDRLRLRRPQSQ